MASGKTHQIACAGAFVAGGITCAYLGLIGILPGKTIESILLGLLVGGLVTPDLDIESSTQEERLLQKIPFIGPVFSGIWETVWFPYAKLLPHRSPFSHWPILGTAGRFFYIYLAARLIMFHLGYNLRLSFDWWFLAAWAVQDTIHWGLDHL